MLNKANQAAAQEIRAFVARRPVAFVGAGMSTPYFTDWKGLLRQLGLDLGLPYDPALDPVTQAERYFRANPDGYKARLIATYGALPADCRAGLKALVLLDLAAILTTCYDYSLIRAFGASGLGTPTLHCYPALPVHQLTRQRTLYFIHGAVQAGAIANLDNFILHESAYLKAYFQEKGRGPGILTTFLVDTFAMNDVLFIGYGLGRDEPLRIALDAAQAMGAEKKRLIVLPTDYPKSERDNFKVRYGIDSVEYDPVDANHSGLDEILVNVKEPMEIPLPLFGSPLGNVDANDWKAR